LFDVYSVSWRAIKYYLKACDSTMEQKNDLLGFDDIVFMLLETLKSNGTFDEIRRHCVTDIDAKV